MLWSVSRSAPASFCVDADGCALVLGDALPRGASERATARELSEAWLSPSGKPTVYDGFYAAVASRNDVLLAGGDVLGLFPICYATSGDVLIMGSASATFGLHPRFGHAMDVEAMCGHLLTGGPFDGRTMRKGVHRLAAGSLLRWCNGVAREVAHYVPPAARVTGTPTFASELERYDAAVDQAVGRHGGLHPDITVLLSGGRDSRLLAGYLARTGIKARALTLGAATDHDASCAAEVAQTLGMKRKREEIPFGEFTDYADRNAHWEMLAGGMSTVHTWGTSDILREKGGAVLSGYVFEARQIAPLPCDSAGMLAWTYGHAIAPERLRALVVEPLRPVVDAVAAAVRARMASMSSETGGDVDAERSWRWLLAVYARFHSGAVPWRLSFGAWPVLPILDQALLEMMRSMPPEFLASRRMQDAVLCARFPELARLPLDRNSNDVSPLVPTLRQRVSSAFGRARPGGEETERRYYARMYDFDNAGWRAIRRAAEPGRDAMTQWFDRTALVSMVPAPQTAAAHADPIAAGFAPKMLTGFMRACVTGDLNP
jgi:asparagine synthase (glutamine-hydrolysing)